MLKHDHHDTPRLTVLFTKLSETLKLHLPMQALRKAGVGLEITLPKALSAGVLRQMWERVLCLMQDFFGLRTCSCVFAPNGVEATREVVEQRRPQADQ